VRWKWRLQGQFATRDSYGAVLYFRKCIKGVDINRADKDGITPLIQAAKYAYRAGSKTIAFLISKGAKVNVQTKKGNTALMLASSAAAKHYEDENVAVVKLLIAKGANVNVRNKAGKTALSVAREGN
jgi:uncharacterized protein